jgi:hypothetical protein
MLGRTGLETSVIGIGLEHLEGQPRETVVATIRRAIEHGVTYFDVIFSMPDYLENVAAGLSAHRDRLLLTGHLGSTDKDGQYQKTRTLKRCTAAFHHVLEKLDTDYVDILFLHNFNTLKDWERSSRRPTGRCPSRRPPARRAAPAPRAAPSAPIRWRGYSKPRRCSNRDARSEIQTSDVCETNGLDQEIPRSQPRSA